MESARDRPSNSTGSSRHQGNAISPSFHARILTRPEPGVQWGLQIRLGTERQ